MSHLVAIKTEIKDMAAVKAMCDEKGWTLREGGYRTYGMGGRQPSDHCIDLNLGPNDLQFDVGLIRKDNGAFELAYDDMLERHIGKHAGKLIQLYGINKTTLEAKKRGYLVTRYTVPNTGKIQLTVSGM